MKISERLRRLDDAVIGPPKRTSVPWHRQTVYALLLGETATRGFIDGARDGDAAVTVVAGLLAAAALGLAAWGSWAAWTGRDASPRDAADGLLLFGAWWTVIGVIGLAFHTDERGLPWSLPRVAFLLLGVTLVLVGWRRRVRAGDGPARLT